MDDVELGQWVDDVEAGSDGQSGGWVRMWTMWNWVRWTMRRLGQNVDDVELGQMDDVELGQNVDNVKLGKKVDDVELGM